MTQEQAKNDPNVVSSTLSVFGCFAIVLFDSRSTHTFVFRRFARKLRVKPEELNSELCVSTPIGSTMCTKNVLRSCKVEIASMTIVVDLIVLDMHDFDVIFGMDLMSICRA